MDALDKIYGMMGYFPGEFGCMVIPGFIYFFVDGRLYRMLVSNQRAISITDVAKEWSLHRHSEFESLLLKMQQEVTA